MKNEINLLLYILCSMTYTLAVGQPSDGDAVERKPYEWKKFVSQRTPASLKQLQQYIGTNTDWEIEEQKACHKAGFQLAKELDKDTLAFSYAYQVGISYSSQIDSISQALVYFNHAIDNAYNEGITFKVYNYLGVMYLGINDYTKALDYFFQSVEKAHLLNKGYETYALGNISDIYEALDKMEEAIKYTKMAIPYSKQIEGNARAYNLSFDYSRLINFYKKSNKIDAAEPYIDSTLEILEIVDTVNNISYNMASYAAYFILADLFFSKNDVKKSISFLKKAKAFLGDHKSSSVLLLEARIAFSQQDYDKVSTLVERFDIEHEAFDITEEMLKFQIEFYLDLRDYENVIELQDKLIEIQQNKFGEDRLRYSTFASAEYQTLEQEEEISMLRKDRQLKALTIRNQQYLMVTTITLLLLIGGIGLFFWNQNQQRKKIGRYLKEEVKRKTANLEQANYELRVFSSIASHDIKEPIRNVGNYAGLIYRKLPSDLKDSLGSYFETIKKSTSQLYTLVEDFARYTSMSREQIIETQPVDLNNLVEGLEHALQEKIKQKNGQVINHGLPIIESNMSLLYSVFKNLIENGLKYNQSETPTVELRYSETNAHHQITVSDNGIGIDKEFHDKVFEMFKRLHHRGEYEGSGIGLAIVKLSIEKLSGLIQLNSTEGEGTQFFISLPKS